MSQWHDHKGITSPKHKLSPELGTSTVRTRVIHNDLVHKSLETSQHFSAEPNTHARPAVVAQHTD